MAVRTKRSISLPPDLATAIESAARDKGMTFSAWIADAAAHRIRMEAGRRGIAEWEAENGRLTVEELAAGRAWARDVLGHRHPADRPPGPAFP
jgi:predicted transcriptional regulator